MRTLNIFDYIIFIFSTINLIRMGIFLIGSDVYLLTAHLALKKKHQETYQPIVSVIIPAHNEEKTIVRAMNSVITNTYSFKKLELIVIDDGSSDNTYKLASEYIKRHPHNKILVVRQENAGKAHALNNGIKNYSHGQLIMCLDADSFISSNAIENSVSYFRDPTVKGVSANIKIINQKTLLNYIQKFEYIITYQMKRAQTVFNIEYIIGGIGSMYRKAMLKKIQYYDTNTVTEDIDLTMKVLQHGNKKNRVIYAADVVAYTESCLSIQALIRQRFRWKWGRYQTFLKNSNMFFNRNKKYTKPLTCIYLPYALYGDFAFFFEPIIIGYILYVTIHYRDLFTLLTACIVLSIYTAINILAEDTIDIGEKILLVVFSPLMYVLLYIMSFVEYVALLKSLGQMHTLRQSLEDGICNWKHVERPNRLSIIPEYE